MKARRQYETVTGKEFVKAMANSFTGYTVLYGGFFSSSFDFAETEIHTDINTKDCTLLLKAKGNAQSMEIEIRDIESISVTSAATEIVYVLKGGTGKGTINLHINK